MHISSLSPLPKIRQPSTLLTCPPNLTGHQRHYLLLLPDWSVDDTRFFYYYQTCHSDDIHNDKEEQDYAIFSTSQKNFPTFSEQIPTKCKPIHLLSSWFDKLSVSARVTKPKNHPPDTMLSNKYQKQRHLKVWFYENEDKQNFKKINTNTQTSNN